MAYKWKLSEAKSKLGEVLTRAANEGPQTIRRRNEEFVVLPQATYEKLTNHRPAFKDWLLNGPALDGIDVPRDRSPMREIEL